VVKADAQTREMVLADRFARRLSRNRIASEVNTELPVSEERFAFTEPFILQSSLPAETELRGPLPPASTREAVVPVDLAPFPKGFNALDTRVFPFPQTIVVIRRLAAFVHVADVIVEARIVRRGAFARAVVPVPHDHVVLIITGGVREANVLVEARIVLREACARAVVPVPHEHVVPTIYCGTRSAVIGLAVVATPAQRETSLARGAPGPRVVVCSANI